MHRCIGSPGRCRADVRPVRLWRDGGQQLGQRRGVPPPPASGTLVLSAVWSAGNTPPWWWEKPKIMPVRVAAGKSISPSLGQMPPSGHTSNAVVWPGTALALHPTTYRP